MRRHFHLIVGSVAGPLFQVGTLILLLVFELTGVILVPIYGLAGVWLSGVVALQIGYGTGILMRGRLEQSGTLRSSTPRRRSL